MTAGNTRFELVVATSENGIIGDQGGMPWHLPRDLRQFKSLTMGHPIVMGRRTWESIGRPLPGRRNIVLTRDRDYVADGADVVHSVEDIVHATDGDAVVMIIGGGEIYRLFLNMADTVHRTRIHCSLEGDTTFPDLSPNAWTMSNQQRHEQDEHNAHAMTFETWSRVATEHPTS